MRHNAAASDVNRDLNSSDFNNSSMDEEPPSEPKKPTEKTQIGSHMSKILAEFDNEDNEE